MNNLRPEDLPVHEKFDLKGSTLGRYASEEERRDPNVTLKDLDLKHELALETRSVVKMNSSTHAEKVADRKSVV